MARKIVVVLKGYPRLSETFIAQEILGLERSGLDLVLMSLRHPTDGRSHPVHDEIQAPIRYLPEYLHDEPRRVARALWRALRLPGFFSALMKFLADYARDRTRNRIRRFGQAAALAVEFPADAQWLHAHFIHTPASVTSYASLMLNIPWSCSAHAKDIWTSPDWELKAKIASARWLVTCTKTGLEKLWSLAADKDKLHLSYHGLDLSRFAPFAGDRPPRDGSNPEDPVILLSVGRAVAKKGYDILLAALALLPPEFAWRFVHIGGGDQIPALKEKAQSLELAHRIDWHGAQAQDSVLARYREADLFVLASRIAADGDRDGLPNVLVEAASQGLACVSTSLSGIAELLINEENALLVEPENPVALADAFARAIRAPALRRRLGDAAEKRVRCDFDHRRSIAQLSKLFAMSGS
jgi:glycosyltransferase involved in cell wall biosynthesis